MKRVLLQEAYLLHRRAYRESSFLIDLVTPDYGRLTLIARAARKVKAASQGLLQPFTPLLVSWAGNGELVTLTQVDLHGDVMQPQGDALYAGFYLNELLMRLTQKWDAHHNIYHAYVKAISALYAEGLQPQTLRAFEKLLLEELGYGLLPKQSTSSSSFIHDQYYRFVPEHGLVLSEMGAEPRSNSNLFLGKRLLAIANEDWHDAEVLQDAKRLMRLMLTPLLGTRPLYSRQLFVRS